MDTAHKLGSRISLTVLLSLAVIAPLAFAPTAVSSSSALFSDGFESGDFAAWSLVKTGGTGAATVQRGVVKSGSFAAQLSETSASGSYAYANATLTAAQPDLTATGDFDVTGQGASGSNVRLFRLYNGSGALVASVYRQNQSGQLGVQHSNSYFGTSGTIALNAWATVALRVVPAGSGAGTVQVWLNGALVYQTADSLDRMLGRK